MPKYLFILGQDKSFFKLSIVSYSVFLPMGLEGAQTVHVLGLIHAVVILILGTYNANTLNICLKKCDACISIQ